MIYKRHSKEIFKNALQKTSEDIMNILTTHLIGNTCLLPWISLALNVWYNYELTFYINLSLSI